MGHSYYSYQGHCPGLPGSGGKSLRLELRAKLPLFTLLPVRGLLGNSAGIKKDPGLLDPGSYRHFLPF